MVFLYIPFSYIAGAKCGFLCSLPDSIGDDLIVEVRDSKGQFCGRVLAQLAAIVDEPVQYLLRLMLCIQDIWLKI